MIFAHPNCATVVVVHVGARRAVLGLWGGADGLSGKIAEGGCGCEPVVPGGVDVAVQVSGVSDGLHDGIEKLVWQLEDERGLGHVRLVVGA